MSYIAADALLTRIGEVLTDSAGSLRTIPLLRFQGNLPEGLDQSAEARRALLTPRADATLIGLKRSASSPPTMGNLLLDRVDVEVRVARLIGRNAQLDEDVQRAARAQAAVDASAIRQAFEYPGNLLTTAAAVATGLASGLLTHERSDFRLKGAIKDGAQILETTHRFFGIVRSTPGTAQAAPTISIALVNASPPIAAGMIVRSTVTGDPAPTLTLYRNGIASGTITALYVTTALDVGVDLFVRATNGAGSANSNTLPGTPVAPSNTVAPVISLNPDWSQLSCTTGTWTQSPTSYSYQWKRAGVAISGATSSTYDTTGNAGASVGATDYGPAITCEVTADNGLASSPTASNALSYLPTAEGAVVRVYLDPSLLSNGLVSSYPDQAGSIALAQATVGARPTKSATSLNGTPGVTFGNGDFMASSAPLDLTSTYAVREVIALAGTYTSGAPFVFTSHGANVLDGANAGYTTCVAYPGLPASTPGIFGAYSPNSVGGFSESVDLATAKVLTLCGDLADDYLRGFMRVNGVAVDPTFGLNDNQVPPVTGYGSATQYLGGVDASSNAAGAIGVRVLMTGNGDDAVLHRVEQFVAWRSGLAPL